MYAAVVHTFGGPEAARFETVPDVEPGAGEVRIAVAAAAVNPVDLLTRSGALAALAPAARPLGLGWDVAGRVDAVGAGVTGFAPGDRVIALVDRLSTPSGAQADAVVVPAGALAKTPDGVDDVAAATLPLNALTVEQSLDVLGLAPNSTVVATGAAGGVGDYVVRLAAQRGHRVIATAGRADLDDVRAAGAHEALARDTDLTVAIRELVPGGVDAVIDGAGVAAAALPWIRDGGGFVALNDVTRPEPERGIAVHRLYVHADGVALQRLVDRAAAGRLALRVADTLPLRDVAEAHRRLAAGGLRGRLVLVP